MTRSVPHENVETHVVRGRHLDLADLHASLADPTMQAMTRLNEIAGRYPDAIPFAAGRPTEHLFDVDDISRYLDRFRSYLAERGLNEEQVARVIMQYGRTKGIVHELVARNLAVDENVNVDPESIVVTVGCQEAMFLVLRALRSTPADVMLAVTPTYVGLNGAASLIDMPVLPVRSGADGVDIGDLHRQLHEARAAGLRPRALYLIPEFANPTGVTLSLPLRKLLLDIAAEQNLLILEDNPYGVFAAPERRLPTLKALDSQCRVIYLGSFAKTALPGARVGYVVADQRVTTPAGEIMLADALATLKSMVTVNTSPIAQAVVAGKLLENDFSLVAANKAENELYHRNMRALRDGLALRLGCDAMSTVSWNEPVGGFFLVLTVPFPVDSALLERSARDFGVLWVPMRDFYIGLGGDHQMRLSCSALDEQGINEGLDRLAALLISELARHERS